MTWTQILIEIRSHLAAALHVGMEMRFQTRMPGARKEHRGPRKAHMGHRKEAASGCCWRWIQTCWNLTQMMEDLKTTGEETDCQCIRKDATEVFWEWRVIFALVL